MLSTVLDPESDAIRMTVDPNRITPSSTADMENIEPAMNICSVKHEDVKEESLDPETTMMTVTRTTNPQTLLKPTILLTTHQASSQPSIINVTPGQQYLSELSVSVKAEPFVSIPSSASSPGDCKLSRIAHAD